MNRYAFLPAVAVIAAVAPAFAQEGTVENHPAAKVVKEYLNLVLQREWSKSAALVEPKSLDSLLVDYVRRVKGARTMDEEEQMVRRVGKESLDQIEKMAPLDFYVAYHEGLQERWNVSPEAIKKVRESLKIKVLSVGDEDATHAHILVRTKHSNDKANISNLELISLVKVGDTWKVGLNEQMPQITPLEGAAEAPAPAAEKPAAEKPAEKPPAKPAGKGKKS